MESSQHMKWELSRKNPDAKEVAFKASKRSKQKKKEQEEYNNNSDISKDDEEVANFIKGLNKGTNSRYRGTLPLIVLIVMVLVILLTNVLIRKKEMMKVNQKEDKHIKVK